MNTNNYEPKLTLTPSLDDMSDTPLAPEIIEEKPPVEVQNFDESNLSPEELAMVKNFASQIDITDSNIVIQYGAGAQKNVADFSQSALQSVRTKELSEVGDMLTSLVTELKGFSPETEEKGILGFFKKSKNKIQTMKLKYDKAEANVDKISGMLEEHQVTLLKDIALMDKMYDMNLNYFKELNMYILAGKMKLQEAQNTLLPALRQKADETQLPEDAQAARDMANMINRFDKKIHDLELTKMISVQMAPQIRLIQNNDSMMVEKIQSTIMNSIPLWKSQMVLALGLAHSQQAIEAQTAVTDMTNELLRKNADALKLGTLEAAKASERSIVDIETLQHTNQQLISTLDEVLAIQQDGTVKRRAAEAELSKIENELKNKLLELRR